MNNGHDSRRDYRDDALHSRTVAFEPQWQGARASWRQQPTPAEPVPEEPAIPVAVEPEPKPEPAVCPEPIQPARNEESPSARKGLTLSPLTLASIVLASVLSGGMGVAALDRWNLQPSTTAQGLATSAEVLTLRQLLDSERASGRETAERLGRIEQRLKEKPDNVPTPAIDLQPILDQLGALRKDLGQIAQEGEWLKAEQVEIKVTQGQIKALVEERRRDTARPVYENASPADVLYQRGVEQFKRTKLAAAQALFRAATEYNAQDARCWYYLALSTARLNNVWEGATPDYWSKGVNCEREAPGSTPQVDASFAGLTQAEGRDWLAFYRSKLPRPAASP